MSRVETPAGYWPDQQYGYAGPKRPRGNPYTSANLRAESPRAKVGSEVAKPLRSAPVERWARRRAPIAAWVLAASALLAGVGAFLPWIVARAVDIGRITKIGVDGDGVVTLILGVAVLLIAGLVLTRRGRWQVVAGLALLSSFGILGVGLYDSADLSGRAQHFHITDYSTVSIGGGVSITIVAGLIGIAGTGVLLIHHDG